MAPLDDLELDELVRCLKMLQGKNFAGGIMSVDLVGLSKVIEAAGGLLPALMSGWSGESAEDDGQKAIKAINADNYSAYRQSVDDGCFAILWHLRDGRNCQPRFLVEEVHPRFGSLDPKARELLLDEFVWRLQFMQTTALISPVIGGKFMISHMGKGYVRVAQDNLDYRQITG